ncbi:acetyl/propionyl/methylcrotonyl-CoA carboxylase subunit alpha [Pelagibacterium sp. H642]|uniref:acetyl/propionyl/methylcrotonyl-CoA carboxylase subunit alpha n=1 Tax=Pelagibacterium sp. H642 TaxID=1881069 RepID=UPI00281508EF|nr:acetyl/propionyl/methylcrotonyl-CoA carboxylase subunit alpha [Pelagibacterium sp. H642]WMT89665.1 acetyl/propionyl/methylcrotonyl-CoA carboxylase subunit alpha [Pelagibacterium sp. H642]
MFSRILIANRGEIACRIIKTARRMGVETVAIYSDADRDALHVKMADEAVHVGAAPAGESYLNIDRIIAACKQTGAVAVHPGYGFLSENPEFAERLRQEGIYFIGPPVKAIEAMGDKITSKKIAAKAGVSTVPGHMGLIENAKEAAAIAGKIGYPVMIKASAGGGGKGMRIVKSEAEVAEGFERAKSEAASSFGDDRVFIEKYIEQPRHIEIQVLADALGNCIHLGERECSIQRRNQKVIEEAPSPFLDAATRAKMGEQAVALAKAVNYVSAGTVEFIVDKDRNFYFLEMNTRLQVEHPVTELITGLDLVEEMLRIADGQKLRWTQEQIRFNGWAVEARIYAEDPYRNFLPSTGRLKRYRPPTEEASAQLVVRNDTGVEEGGEISPYYDPMIAKLVTWAPSRTEAIDGLAVALDQSEIEGVGNNIPFLAAVTQQDRFRKGRLSTSYIAEEFPAGFSGVELDDETLQTLAALACRAAFQLETRGFLEPTPLTREHVIAERSVIIGDRRWDFSIPKSGEAFVLMTDHGQGLLIEDGWQPGASLTATEIDGRTLYVKMDRITSGFRMRYRGADITAKVVMPHVADLMRIMPNKAPPDMSRFLVCPMPGQILRMDVAEGDVVEEGQSLAIVEAMKMENVLRAERRARVARINAGAGDILTVDAVIMEFEAV